jgi:hypothetical protein
MTMFPLATGNIDIPPSGVARGAGGGPPRAAVWEGRQSGTPENFFSLANGGEGRRGEVRATHL